ncbi:hypothetical protein ACIQ6V_32575 [Streptomyces sp. NPDC096198]|uniref:hypothetical protein n=1 Tax=Streptomyces sp. NPDC096198 TaxID=3366080 RepID=UPI00382140C5
MVREQDGERREFVLEAGLATAEIEQVHREALRVLRPDIDIGIDLDVRNDEQFGVCGAGGAGRPVGEVTVSRWGAVGFRRPAR